MCGSPVRDAKPLHTAVHGEHVGDMPVVEPEPRCVDQHGPVVCVTTREEVLGRLLSPHNHFDERKRRHKCESILNSKWWWKSSAVLPIVDTRHIYIF